MCQDPQINQINTKVGLGQTKILCRRKSGDRTPESFSLLRLQRYRYRTRFSPPPVGSELFIVVSPPSCPWQCGVILALWHLTFFNPFAPDRSGVCLRWLPLGIQPHGLRVPSSTYTCCFVDTWRKMVQPWGDCSLRESVELPIERRGPPFSLLCNETLTSS